MLDAALGYAKLGLPVFPLWTAVPSITGGGFICACGKLHKDRNAAKHPMARLAPNGFKDATTDEAKVRHFWSCAPNANIGIATSREHAVLDVDLARRDRRRRPPLFHRRHRAQEQRGQDWARLGHPRRRRLRRRAAVPTC